MSSSARESWLRGPLPYAGLVAIGMAIWASLGTIPDLFQLIFFGIVVIGLGIPHGAIDHLVSAKHHQHDGKSFHLLGFYVRYLAILGLIIVLWLVLPTWSLVAFVLISALHFGETDLSPLVRPLSGRWLLYMGYGLSLLLVLFIPNTEAVASVLGDLSPEFTAGAVAWLDQFGWWLVAGLAVPTVALALIYANSHADRVHVLVLTGFGGILAFLPLLVGFAVYFGGVHSLHAYEDIRGYLSQGESKWSRGKLVRAMLPLSLLAVPGTALIGYLGLHFLNPILLIFIFIASLTYPHVGVMRRIYRFSPSSD